MKAFTRIGRHILAATLTMALFTLPAGAHHSTSAFDSESVVTIVGEVTQVRWINPHASFKLSGTADIGPDGLWTIEMTAPNVLYNQGWKRTSLSVGDQVTVFANPLRNSVTLNDGSQGGLYIGVILKDGATLGRTDGEGRGTDQ